MTPIYEPQTRAYRPLPLVKTLPRSIYSDEDENRAWRGAIEMARYCIRPKRVVSNRRVLGLVQGRQDNPGVVVHRFHPASKWSERDAAYRRMWMSSGWTNYDGIISDVTAGKAGRTYFCKTPSSAVGAAGNWYDDWPITGNPAPGTVTGTAFTARQYDDTTTGALTHRGNVSTDWKFLLSMGAISSATTPMVMLYDRVLSYDQCTFNASVNQGMTNTLTAQRYNSGAPGLLIMAMSCTANGATAANLTQLRYTNQAGTTLQSMPTSPTVAFIASVAAPTTVIPARQCLPGFGGFSLPLASGDTGVRLINDYTTSAANTGTNCFILMHPIADMMIPVALVPQETDHVFQISDLERVYDGACLAFAHYASATTGWVLQGSIRYAW